MEGKKMKKLLILALGALLVGNVSAREVKRVHHNDFRKGGEKVIVIKEAQRCPCMDFRFMEAFKADFRKGEFMKRDLRKCEFCKEKAKKFHKFQKEPKRHMRR